VHPGLAAEAYNEPVLTTLHAARMVSRTSLTLRESRPQIHKH